MDYRYRSLPRQQPPAFTRIVGLVTGALLGAVALVIGSLFFLIVLGVSLVAAAFIYVRMWWLKRQVSRQNGEQSAHQSGRQQYRQRGSRGQVLEGEYTVVDEKESNPR